MATVSRTSSSLAPLALAAAGWEEAPDWQGIGAAPARQMRSLVLPSSLVLGLSCTALNSAQAPAMADSGNALKKLGTEPSVCSMSRYVACAEASSALATDASAVTSPIPIAVASVMVIPVVLRIVRLLAVEPGTCGVHDRLPARASWVGQQGGISLRPNGPLWGWPDRASA